MSFPFHGDNMPTALASDLFGALAADLDHLRHHHSPPTERLAAAPILTAWSKTWMPMPAIIGQRGQDGLPSIVLPTFAISAEGSWARTLHGWVRLGRHVDDRTPMM